MEIENPVIKGEHKSFQFNDYVERKEHFCTYCHDNFESYTGGLQLDSDTYCSLDCLFKDLTENGLLKEI